MSHELGLIGAALQDPRIATAAKITGHHFADARYGETWDTIVRIAAEDQQPTPSLVCHRLGITGERAQLLAADLVDALTSSIVANHEAHAAAILEAHEREQLRNAATRAIAMLDADQPLEGIRSALSVTGTDDDDQLATTVQTSDEFIDQPLPPTQWIIPDMLAAGDRMMLTGGEGSGKSILLRQIGMCVAAGVHPFNRSPIAPSRVLIVDAENPLGIMVAKFGAIRDALRLGGYNAGDRLLIHRQPAGLDLTQPKGRTHLRALCRMTSPDLLIIGPVYKLYVPSDARDEVHARQVAALIDEIRAEHDCAVLTEHHTPMEQAGGKRPIRPVGTGLWLRWPEFGFGIVPQEGFKTEDRRMALVPWRGSRDERAWPTRLQGGANAPGRLPWNDEDNIGRPWGGRRLTA